MPKRNWWAARAIVGQRRANRRGGLEYLVAWEGSDEEGTPWPDLEGLMAVFKHELRVRLPAIQHQQGVYNTYSHRTYSLCTHIMRPGPVKYHTNGTNWQREITSCPKMVER